MVTLIKQDVPLTSRKFLYIFSESLGVLIDLTSKPPGTTEWE